MMKHKKLTPDLSRNLKQAQRVYREPIEIQAKSEPSQKPDGTWTKSEWKTWKKVFANTRNLRGSEYFTAGQVGKQETTKFFIRYMPGLNNKVKEEYRILYRNKKYNIDFVDNIGYLNEELEIKAIERRITDASD